MKFLMIGGTRFLGRAIVDAALARGHEVTLFNRGQSSPDLYSELEHIKGDRNSDLDLLAGHKWDGVLDTCGYIPRQVRELAAVLKENVDHYTFISSISVYSDNSIVNMDESGPLGTLEDETVEEVNYETYGPLKVLCEKAAAEGMNGRATNVRAGLIVGPNDLSDRFTYWPYRVERGGEILAPGRPDAPVQIIDVRDIGLWSVLATERKLAGDFNVTGPDYPLTMSKVLETCQEVSGRSATFTWVDDAFLVAKEVGAYVEMPLWVPAEGNEGFNTVNCQKAIAAGLTFRPLAETVKDTLEWLHTREDHQWRGGLKLEREAALLEEWHSRK